jgi:hypothetical protein
MSAQLRTDVVRALAAACDYVKAQGADAPHLVDDVMQLVDVAFRFLEQDRDLWKARRAVVEPVENTMLSINRAMDQNAPVPGEEGRVPQRGVAGDEKITSHRQCR